VSIDWDGLLYGPAAAVLGVTATFVLDDTDGTTFDLDDVHDMTAGATTGRDVQLDTIRPAADVRAVALAAAGVTAEDLIEATLTMNGKDWTVKSMLPLPAPTGEGQGEVRLILEEA